MVRGWKIEKARRVPSGLQGDCVCAAALPAAGLGLSDVESDESSREVGLDVSH